MDNNVVIVKEVHAHNVIVVHKDGTTQEVDIVRENTDENSKKLEGSEYEIIVEEELVE